VTSCVRLDATMPRELLSVGRSNEVLRIVLVVSARTLDGERTLGRPRRIWENIKIYLK
jgi:hypothetical protein